MKKSLISIMLLMLLVATAGYFYFNNNSGTIKQELSDFAVKDTAAVTKIFLADKQGNEVLLERQEQGKWRLNKDYYARQDAINNLLETIKRIRVRTPVPKSAFENIVKNIASHSTKVEVYQGGEKPVKVYYVGPPNQDHSGTYMLLENSTVPFLMHIEGFRGYPGPRYFIDAEEWRDRTVFAYPLKEIATVKVEYPQQPEQSFIIETTEDNQISLKTLDGNNVIEFDTVAVAKYLSAYKKVNFESFEQTKTQAFKDSILQTPVQQIYTATDKAGNTRQIKTFLKPAHKGAQDYDGNPIDYDLDRMYGLLNDSEFVVIQYFVFDRLNKELDDFRD